MNEQQIRTLMKEGKYKEITGRRGPSTPEARTIWRELYQVPSFEADERRRTDEWEQERNTAAFNAKMEGGRPLPWHLVVPLPKPSDEVLKLFRGSSSKHLWLQKMYDSVFPNDKAREKETREEAEYHRRIWASIDLCYQNQPENFFHAFPPRFVALLRAQLDRLKRSKTTQQTKHAYQDPKPAPLLHTIYSAPKTARIFTRWIGKSRFSEAANPEERVTARLYHAADCFFQDLRREKHWRQCQDGVVFSTNYYKWLSTLPADQKPEGFGKKFFEMPLDETDVYRKAQVKRLERLKKKRLKAVKDKDQTTAKKLADTITTLVELQKNPSEGELFLPSTKSSRDLIVGRELGRSDATLVFDKTTSTFYLQKVKQKKKARKRADAKLPLFSLPALDKGGAVELLKLWNTVTEKTKHLREWKIVSENFTSVEYLRDNRELLQRFLQLAVKFCTDQAAASIEYKPAVSLSAHRRMNLEEQEQMICNSSALEVTEDYAKWVARAYALLMLPAGVRGSVRGLGWPDQRYWEPFRDADGRSPASVSFAREWKEDQEEQIVETKGYTISTTRRKPRVEGVRTAADQSRADDWEGSEQQEISSLST